MRRNNRFHSPLQYTIFEKTMDDMDLIDELFDD